MKDFLTIGCLLVFTVSKGFFALSTVFYLKQTLPELIDASFGTGENAEDVDERGPPCLMLF